MLLKSIFSVSPWPSRKVSGPSSCLLLPGKEESLVLTAAGARSLQAWWLAPGVLPLPLFLLHNTCAFLHWWSPEVTSPARRSFLGQKGNWSEMASHMLAPLPEFPSLATLCAGRAGQQPCYFHQPCPCDSHQAKVLCKQLH